MGFWKGFGEGKKIFSTAAKKSQDLITVDDELLVEMHRTMLGMYKDVAAVCDKYKIRLFLIGGSALGAVRHKGFIPWDDDMDLSMTRSDYKRFCRIFEKELGDKYILNAPNYSPYAKNRFPRILKKDSHLRTIIDNNDPELQKIFIDLFILDNCPNNPVLRKIKGTYCNFLLVMSWLVYIYENRDERLKDFLTSAGTANYYVRIAAGKLFSFRRSYEWFNTFDKAAQHHNEKSEYMCLPCGRMRYFGEIFRRDQFLPGRFEEFEGEKVRIFTDKDPYLRNLYGDYMQLPPEEKRERHNVVELSFHA